MFRRMNLSYLASGVMVLWLLVLGARLLFGNHVWQDIVQILVGVLFILYGLALIQNWQGAGQALIDRSWVVRQPDTEALDVEPKPSRYQRAGYLWLFSGVLLIVAAVILIVTR